jgi:hypothetical protein
MRVIVSGQRGASSIRSRRERDGGGEGQPQKAEPAPARGAPRESHATGEATADS